MSWLRLDDGFAQHPKIVQLSARDRWTWLELLCYCARYRTDGQIPDAIAEVVRGATPAFIARALELRLLDSVPVPEPVPGTSGKALRVHDWDEYNPKRYDEGDLSDRVNDAIQANPEASANELQKLIGGSRKLVLQAIRDHDRRLSTGTRTGSRTSGGTSARTGYAPAFPSRPQELQAAAAVRNEDDQGAAAALIRQRLQSIGITDAIHEIESAPLDLLTAWLDVAASDAKENPAGFVIAGVRSGRPPSPRARANTSDEPIESPVERRLRFVETSGWRFTTEDLADELAEMGAVDGELVSLLERAAALRDAA